MFRRNNPLNWFLLLLTMLPISCTVYAPDERHNLHRAFPARFTFYREVPPNSANRWWEMFQSNKLNVLVEKALTNNPSIRQSWARLYQADAIAAKAGAIRYPQFDYNFRGSGRREKGGGTTVQQYMAGLSAEYEVDLWGRIKSTAEAAVMDREASRETLHAAAISLSARVVMAWIGIITQRWQIEVIRSQLESNRSILELIEMRFRQSLSSALDVYQQRQRVASVESLIPQREKMEKLQRNTLAILLGETHFSSLEIDQNRLPEPGPLPPIGLPAEVLANRPDIRAAGLRLRAADWQVSAARADRMPAIRLTGSIEDEGRNLVDIFDNWSANLAASLIGPIFEGGRRKAEVERSRAVAEERLAAYHETVLNAIREVEDALISESKQYDYLAKLEDRLIAAKHSYEESIFRYRNGLVEYTTVLRELNILQELERIRVEALHQLLRYRIDLCRALGGSWPNELSPPG